MKKMTRFLALILALSMLCTVAVGAEEGTDDDQAVYNITFEEGYEDYSLTPLDAEGAAITAVSREIGGKAYTDVYPNAARFKLTFPGTEDVQYVVFLLSDENDFPIEDNIRYIDQVTGTTTVEFDLFPDDITAPGEYRVCLSATSTNFAEVASFWVTEPPKPDVLLGDADVDGDVDVLDASWVLQHLVGILTLSPEGIDNARVVDGVTLSVLDASYILQKLVGLINQFPVEVK